MKKFTVLDLANILQLDEPVKEDLRLNYESYDADLKSEISDVLWNGLHMLKEKLAEQRYEQYLTEVEEGKRELTSDLYNDALRSVWQDFDDVVSGKKKELEQIDEIRAKLKLPSPTSQ